MFSLLVFATLASSVNALPLNKRIAQTISDSTAKWEQACLAAGGADQCNPLSITAFSTLLAAAGACDQQNAADQMIDLAKTLNNDADMITFTQIFVQQPRNSPDSFSIPYCQQAPKNSELNGLFQCQFQGTKDTFVGNLQPGAEGTVPFGLQSLATPKSCPANPQGGIADGSQLSDITQDPGLNNVQSEGGSGAAASGSESSGASATATATSVASSASASSTDDGSSGDDGEDDGEDDGSDDCSGDSSASATDTTATATSAAGGAAASASSSSSSSSNFQLQNGKDAQALNAQFATLTADSSCQEGENACVGTSFAMCVSGKFVLTDCAASSDTLTCAALPLVNSAGTSITCATKDDALQRIEATGATGGLTGSD